MNLNNVTYLSKIWKIWRRRGLNFQYTKVGILKMESTVYKSQSGPTALCSFITFLNKQTFMYLNKCHVTEARE